VHKQRRNGRAPATSFSGTGQDRTGQDRTGERAI